MNVLLTQAPTNVAQPTQIIDMNTAIRAYSSAVAPEQSSRNGKRAVRTR